MSTIAPLAAVPALDPRRSEYVALLTALDWQFEWSDDARVWARGVTQFARLQALRREIDPDYVLWNQHCPPAERRPPPAWSPQ